MCLGECLPRYSFLHVAEVICAGEIWLDVIACFLKMIEGLVGKSKWFQFSLVMMLRPRWCTQSQGQLTRASEKNHILPTVAVCCSFSIGTVLSCSPLPLYLLFASWYPVCISSLSDTYLCTFHIGDLVCCPLHLAIVNCHLRL